ncbi:S8 family peptidase [Microbacterium sp. Clip185]|uniref:S8 family peptidase n=1 Tax=Microbacterium sp. Clip185 TaxID=3025663 RepID=UPI00236543B7|nr:S8/S53 family peptidase [Microbacterium sp. Clip185]WDG18501.1 S8/S53 family peptidase [Microbacterium sp. Clip185]
MTALLVVAATSTTAPASAADGGQWWYEGYHVQDAHDAGWTGKGVKIAVVDSQINPELPDFAGADLTVAPGAACEGAEPSTTEANAESEHGSTVTAMLIGNGTGVAGTKGIAPESSVTFYGVGALADCTPTPDVEASGHSPLMWMIQRALDDGADVIMTTVVVGEVTRLDSETVAQAVANKVPLVAGNPNDAFKQGILPASFNGVVAVSAIDSSSNLPLGALGVQNAIPQTTVVAPGVDISTIGDTTGSWDVAGIGTGTSLATPLVAGILAVGMQKYPDATGNQLIQSLVHNTGAEEHPLQYNDSDGFGYGTASLTRVLSADPLQYTDTNPLLEKSSQDPSVEQIADAEKVLASAVTTPPAESTGGSPLLPVFIGVGVGLLVLIVVGVVVTVVLVRRSRRRVGA